MKSQSPAQKFLSEKRERRRLKNIADEKRRRMELARRKGIPFYTPQTLHILQQYIPQDVVEGGNLTEIITIPKTFSIVEDTENALKIIYKLVAFSNRHPSPEEIYFDHSALTNFDLTAETILDVVALDFKRVQRQAKKEFLLRGKFPTDASANRFIRAVGIIKNLKLSRFYLPTEEEQKLKILRCTSYATLLRVSEASPSERAARKLVDYFNKCLAVSNLELTARGRHRLVLYTGEVLDNATQHSGTKDWVLAGYLDPDSPERICEISIFNFGRSYADTFLNLPRGHFMRQLVDPFVELHRKRGLFRQGWEPDNLLSVIALQEQVSAKKESYQDTRGNGTVDLIQFFQDIHSETPIKGNQTAKMVIISGRTRILFDGKHAMAPDSKGRQIIAFNSENSLEKPPDKTHVKCLNGIQFPGTIVSIRFPLPQKAIQSVVKR